MFSAVWCNTSPQQLSVTSSGETAINLVLSLEHANSFLSSSIWLWLYFSIFVSGEENAVFIVWAHRIWCCFLNYPVGKKAEITSLPIQKFLCCTWWGQCLIADSRGYVQFLNLHLTTDKRVMFLCAAQLISAYSLITFFQNPHWLSVTDLFFLFHRIGYSIYCLSGWSYEKSQHFAWKLP